MSMSDEIKSMCGIDTCEHGHLARKCEVCELKAALKVLAEEAHAWRTHTEENYYTNALRAARKTDSTPIAAEAVREAGR